MTGVVSVDDVVSKYVALRDQKNKIINETKQIVAEITAKMNKLEGWLLQRMQVDGVSGYPTAHGTAYKVTTDHAGVADWDAVLAFVRENEAWHMLEKRVSKSAIRGYLDEGQPLPPGINYFTRVDINVRKPTER